MSADGTRLTYVTGGQLSNVHDADGVRVYDSATHDIRVLQPGYGGLISGDGRFLYYAGRGRRVPLSDYERLALDSGERRFLPLGFGVPGFGFFKGIIDYLGERVVFQAYFERDTQTANIYDATDNSIRRVPGALPHFIQEVALSRDGTTVAFTSGDALDLTAPPPTGYLQAFVYRIGEEAAHQVTGREDTGGAFQPRVSADGRLLSYRGNPESALHVADVATGALLYRFDAGEEHGIGSYILSDDGNILVFTTTADLDPAVGNPEYWNQLFRLDRRSGVVEQLTDVTSPAGIFETMDAEARTFFLGVGGTMEVDGLTLQLHGVRLVERREVNRSPTIVAPASVSGREGRPIRIPLAGSDPDGDPLTFFAELDTSPSPSITNLAPHLPDITDADGDGQAELTLWPSFAHGGHHRLQVAVFDDGGGAAARVVDLFIEDVAAAGVDLNCDHRFDAADPGIVTHFLFNTFLLSGGPLGRQCRDSDVNGDGATTAADLAALFHLYRPEASAAGER